MRILNGKDTQEVLRQFKCHYCYINFGDIPRPRLILKPLLCKKGTVTACGDWGLGISTGLRASLSLSSPKVDYDTRIQVQILYSEAKIQL